MTRARGERVKKEVNQDRTRMLQKVMMKLRCSVKANIVTLTMMELIRPVKLRANVLLLSRNLSKAIHTKGRVLIWC